MPNEPTEEERLPPHPAAAVSPLPVAAQKPPKAISPVIPSFLPKAARLAARNARPEKPGDRSDGSFHPPALRPDCAVLLDFDGTLVEIAARPEAVVVDTALEHLLLRLNRHLGGRLALVSGRSIAQLEGFLGTLAREISVIGSHGAERRLAGAETLAPQRPRALDRAATFFRKAFADRPGVIIESKSFGVAVHFRLDPASETEARFYVQAFAGRHGLVVQEGKLMVELRMPGHDKGTAIAALLQSPPFAGHAPYFVGDDLTDEPGFAVCRELGGAGILVGAARPTAALYRLDNVATVRAWLAGAMA